jgi:hypothetical protein
MSRPRAHLFILVCLLLAAPLTKAQDASVGPTEEEKAAEKQAIELLDSIAEGIPSLRNSANRIYLTSAVADLFWTTDEKRARALFEVVTQEVVKATADFDAGDLPSNNNFEVLQQRRRECLERMARRDPEMALAFLRATRPLSRSANSNQQANETSLELYVVGLLAAKNPELALKLGRQVLTKGLSYPLISILSQLCAQNKDLGQTLYREVLARLKTEDFNRNQDAAGAAWNLLYSFQPPQADEDSYRELVDLLAGDIAYALSNPATRNQQNYQSQLQSLMPLLEKYAPARMPQLRQLLQNVKPAVDPNARIYQTLNEVNQRGTVDDLLALAEKLGPEFRHHAYQQAAWKALAGGDANRARQIVLEFVPEPEQRRQMLERMNSELLWSAINESKVAEARDLLSNVKSVEQHVPLLINLALNVANKGDKRQALDLLFEAKTMLDSMPANSGKLNTQLQLAQGYASIDATQSVALMQSIVSVVNQLVAAATVLDGFENSYLQDGEWIKPGSTTLGNLVNNIEQNLGQLALRDAEGARRISNQLERPEIRLMAQMEIAQALIGKVNGSSPTGHSSRRFNSLPRSSKQLRR